jgi:hypothetical protein
MTKPEMLDDFLCSRGAASFDQDKIAGRGDLIQQFCGFRCRVYNGSLL